MAYACAFYTKIIVPLYSINQKKKHYTRTNSKTARSEYGVPRLRRQSTKSKSHISGA